MKPVVSFNPWIEADINFFQFTALSEEVLSALKEARAVLLPQTVSQELFFFVKALGKPVFPEYEYRFRFPGKIGQILLFEALRLPYPETTCVPRICAFGPHPGTIKPKLPPFPFVVKGNLGHEGREVFLVNSDEDWERVLKVLRNFEASGRYGFLIQKYIPWDYDLRVVVIGKRRLRFWRRGGFRKNIVQEGEVVDCPSKELESKALELLELFVERTRLDLMAVDFLFDPEKGEVFFNEVNFVFGLRLLGGEEGFRAYLREAASEFLKKYS